MSWRHLNLMDIAFKELSGNSIQSWISRSSFIINVIKAKLYDYKKLYPHIFQRNILWTQNRINRHQNYQCHQFVQRLTWENAHLDGVVDDHCHASEITEMFRCRRLYIHICVSVPDVIFSWSSSSNLLLLQVVG